MRAVLFDRVSTKGQEPELQMPELVKYCAERNLELVRTFKKQESAFKNKDLWEEEIDWCKKNDIKCIVVWNMDRFSRLPEDEVLQATRILSTVYGIEIRCVRGDSWSAVIELMGKLPEMGFIGKALSEFIETLLKGLEFQRAHRESVVKGERVKLAVRRPKDGPTLSYKGKKWGRRALPKQTIDRVLALRQEHPEMSIREIAAQVKTYQGEKEKTLSKSVVHKILAENAPGKSGKTDASQMDQLKDTDVVQNG